MKKILTIGIAAYNVENTISRCLDSVIIPSINSNIEILVINDGSTDQTPKIVKNYVKKYPGTVKLVNKNNGGHGSAINTAIKFATGNYFKMVDGDDKVEKKGFVSLINKLKKSTADIVFSPYYRVNINNNNKKEIGYLKSNNRICLNNKVVNISEYSNNLIVAMHSITYKTSILKESKYRIDEHCYYVDVEYTIYYLPNTKKGLLLSEPVYDYSVGSSNQSINKKIMLKRRKQHLKVCKSLVLFYEKQRFNVSSSMNEMLKNNIVRMILINEYLLLMSISNSTESYAEIKDFDQYLRKNSKSLYDEVPKLGEGQKLELLVFWRKTNFFGYRLMHSVFKKKFIN